MSSDVTVTPIHFTGPDFPKPSLRVAKAMAAAHGVIIAAVLVHPSIADEARAALPGAAVLTSEDVEPGAWAVQAVLPV